ncbi:hypothetical protein CH292_28070 [Rhodococcus sp. 14-2470-1a]|nr:hypothetical protein CH292_27915 [Rhodococcus sp. 14-2470-1a]OZF41356.1 hypothetical protein CH292_28070 [Rhodococcus sp. 14-2470-1a]
MSAPNVQTAHYDLTAELEDVSVPDQTALVVAAFAVTLCRWTGTAFTTISCDGRAVRLEVDDHSRIDEFLTSVCTAVDDQNGTIDLAITSSSGDPRSGEVRFNVAVPYSEHGFITDVATAVNELSLLTEGYLHDVRCIAPERRRILHTLVGADCPPVDIVSLFFQQVKDRPEAVAVRDTQMQLTYTQLASASSQFADALRKAGVQPMDTVLVAIRRSVGEVVALLATLRIGAAYAGFDDDAPEQRLSRIVQRLAPAAAVVDAATSNHPALRGVTRVEAWEPVQHGDIPFDYSSFEPAPQDPRRTAYIAFTSGSTGEPKGVVVPHRAVTRLALTPELQVLPGDRVLRMAPLAFDASTYEIWATLLNGATLEVFPGRIPTVGRLETFFRERRISVAWLTASLFRLVVDSRPQILSGLRWLLSGGEVVPHKTAAQALGMHPGLTITNGYGPTENTTFTTTYTVRDSAEIDGPLPIGKPIGGSTVYVLDQGFRLVPPGAIGELYAAGSGLADSYLGDELETAKRFGYFSPDIDERLYRTGDLVRINPHGDLVFLGRADKQVKLHGHRIETDEICSALIQHPDIRDAVVVVAQEPDQSMQLVAAIIVHPSADVDPQAWRSHLSHVLPSYAIPPLWVVVDEIPLTRNGKIDEQALINSSKRPNSMGSYGGVLAGRES